MNGDTIADKKYRKELQKFRKSIKPYVRKYEPGYWENQKTASFKDSLSDTVYQPKDPYLKKFYTGEISTDDVERYINKQEKGVYANEVYFPSRRRRSYKDATEYRIHSKYDKIRDTAMAVGGLGVVSAFPSLLAAPFTMKPLMASGALIGLGALGTKLAPSEPPDLQDRQMNIYTDKLIQDYELDKPVHNALRLAYKQHRIDDTGYLQSEKDEQDFFDKHQKYFHPNKQVQVPYVRSFNVNEKTAALAEELNPVPKSKRDRSAFQTFVDTLSTNKVRHVGGTVGGVAGMLAGRELLHSDLTPMRALGGVGVVGGATLGAKNIYGLYKDYFD